MNILKRIAERIVRPSWTEADKSLNGRILATTTVKQEFRQTCILHLGICTEQTPFVRQKFDGMILLTKVIIEGRGHGNEKGDLFRWAFFWEDGIRETMRLGEDV